MKIAMLLSGGVDSSVALHLLKQDPNNEIVAFYIKIWLEEDLQFLGECPWQEDIAFARAVCDRLSVPLHIVPMQKTYLDRVVSHAINVLKSGGTPSPDILCNQHIKFGEFYDYIESSYDVVATGHYAQCHQRFGVSYLVRSVDPIKDQTYFLYRLSQNQLKRAMFPIGDLHKSNVRKLAHTFDLPNQTRKDSQGLCFLGKIRYDEFVKFHLGLKKGKVVEFESGRTLGEHNGYWFYTIGQRQGLGLSGGPWYVVRKDSKHNIIYISHQDNFQDQSRSSFIVSDVHWISGKPTRNKLKLKIRHGPAIRDCDIAFQPENKIRVTMEDKDTGVAVGQSAIFYSDKFCLGGGVIESVEPS